MLIHMRKRGGRDSDKKMTDHFEGSLMDILRQYILTLKIVEICNLEQGYGRGFWQWYCWMENLKTNVFTYQKCHGLTDAPSPSHIDWCITSHRIAGLNFKVSSSHSPFVKASTLRSKLVFNTTVPSSSAPWYIRTPGIYRSSPDMTK